MKYNFDEIIDRSGTACEKYDKLGEVFGASDIIPLWVADMDFNVAEPIVEALRARTEHKIYGYTYQPQPYFDAIINWQLRRNAWHIKREWISFCPGVVPGLNFAVQSLTNAGDKIVILTPVYKPFYMAATDHNRELVECELQHSGLDYTINYANLDDKLNGARMLIFCNPHNPVGRVWQRNELERVAELCIKHNVIILSDEIHSDLIFAPHKHTPFASLAPEISQRTLTFFAPSKTFNIAGFATGVAVTENKEIFEKYNSTINHFHISEGNLFGIIALQAAYNGGEEWLTQLLNYLRGNAQFVIDFLQKNIPQVKTKMPEGTYLMWVDFSALNLPQTELMNLLVHKAKVGLNDGEIFGKPTGTGFMRLNIACPRSVLEKALNQIEKAIKN